MQLAPVYLELSSLFYGAQTVHLYDLNNGNIFPIYV